MEKQLKNNSWNDLIIKFLDGTITISEKEKLDDWIASSRENQKLFNDAKKLWKHSESLSSFTTVNVKGDWLKTSRRIGFAKGSGNIKRIVIQRTIFLKIAAMAIILVGLGLLIKYTIYQSPEMILVKSGEKTRDVILPDNSTVVLNQFSSIGYPEKFRGNMRQVKLSGEGYFDVTKNPKKKFRILVDSSTVVEVLGTSFNIKSESNGSTVDVQVLTGKVAFYSQESEQVKLFLEKEEKAVLRNGIIYKESNPDKNAISWKTGILIFENDKLEKVISDLNEFYRCDIEIENINTENYRFTSKIDNQNLESVLEEMKLVLNLNYKISEGTVTLFK